MKLKDCTVSYTGTHEFYEAVVQMTSLAHAKFSR